MPIYYYRALTADGQSVEGEIEASSQDAVIAKLQASGHLPILTEELNNTAQTGRKLSRSAKGFSKSDVQLFTSKLAIMLRAGITLDQSLETLSGLYQSEKSQQLLLKIRDEVRNGATLADALSNYPSIFNKLYINTVRAGEAAGALDTVLARLSEYLERSRQLSETVKSALIYPGVLLAVALTSLIILMVYVVPQFKELYAEADQALPLPTLIVISASNFMIKFWWVLIIVIVGGVYLFKRKYRQAESKMKIDQFLINLPLIGDLITKLDVARFSRTLATLSANGVPLLTGLDIVKDILTNAVLQNSVSTAIEQLREGHGISAPLSQSPHFPKLAVQLIHVGEETGELEKMLNELADVYDQEVQESVKRFLALLEPAVIIGLGLLIAGIIVSILLAIIGLNDFAI